MMTLNEEDLKNEDNLKNKDNPNRPEKAASGACGQSHCFEDFLTEDGGGRVDDG